MAKIRTQKKAARKKKAPARHRTQEARPAAKQEKIKATKKKATAGRRARSVTKGAAEAARAPAKREKLKLAFYWAASCGGCEIAVLEIAEKILDVIAVADIVFWPCIADFKYHHVEAYPDQTIDVCFFNGAIRTDENREVAELLRRKSKVLIAYGSCAHEGCIPALANLHSRAAIFERAYLDNPSTPNPERVTPATRTTVEGRELTLPAFWDTVVTLAQVVPVDYFVPGCPPTEKMTWACIETIVAGQLPARGSLIGAGDKSVCDECKYERRDTPINEIKRPHLYQPAAGDDQCLLEQGLICLGPATRSGCEARCLDARLGCRGCYGAAGAAIDQGSKMIAALGSLLAGQSDTEVRAVADQIVDPVGTFYRFGMAGSLLERKRLTREMEA